MLRPYDGRIVSNATYIPLADESVHMCVTSPPYWGLRSYQIPDQVFGGNFFCVHKWDGPRRRGGSAGAQGTGSCRPGRMNVKAQKRQNDSLGSFCEKCGAWSGQLGLEPDPYLYIDHMVQVFREVWRVLRKDGTLWLNIGDCYATGAGTAKSPGGGLQGARWSGDVDRLRDQKRGYRGERLANGRGDQPAVGRLKTRDDRKGRGTPSKAGAGDHVSYGPASQPNRGAIPGMKSKDMAGMPWRLALALQADGWYWRSTIVWAKPSPMPGSQKDRPTSSWEPMFLFAKSEHYFYDYVAVMEPCTGNAHSRGNGTGPKTHEGDQGQNRNNVSFSQAVTDVVLARNKRDVWTIASEPLGEKHYAAFPQALVESCILAGTSERGCCPECQAPFKRVVERQMHGNMHPDQALRDQGIRRTSKESKAKWREAEKQAGNRRMMENVELARAAGADHDQPFLPPRTIAWKKTCRCPLTAADITPSPAIVLDPFAGSGTVARVAEKLDRRWISLDLGYQDMQARRIRGVQKKLAGLYTQEVLV